MLAVARATYYRTLRPVHGPRRPSNSPRALERGEREQVLDVLHEERFVDQAPAEVYATLLDEGRYLCSERTMYRILEANAEVRERRDQRAGDRQTAAGTPRWRKAAGAALAG